MKPLVTGGRVRGQGDKGAGLRRTVRSARASIGAFVGRLAAACAAAAVGAALLVPLAASPAAAQAQAAGQPTGQRLVAVDRQAGRHAGELVVAVNKSEILRLDQPYEELLVGNPEVADVMALTNRSIYVLGKGLGTTNLTIYGPRKQLIAVVDLVVSFDTEGLKAKFFEVMPNEKVEVRGVSGGIVLSGSVSSANDVSRATQLAERYAPGKVSNFLQVRGSQQVMLQVKFAEVQRSLIKDLRTGTTARFSGGDFNAVIGGGDANLDPNVATTAASGLAGLSTVIVRETSLGRGLATLLTGNWSLSAAFDALEEKGVVKTLAEPNLIALSGETASFLAGGEFPFPTAQSGTGTGGVAAITIEFKEFGVGLAFTPTVIGEDLINLSVAPEVSAIDRTVQVTVGGVGVPGLTTRRAKTTVELRDGQSFMIAGLLQNDFSDNIRQWPWLGDVPILGNLFRSPSFNRKETELVVLVTPRLVKPAKAGTLAAPTDRFVPPTDPDLFLHGRLEGRAGPDSGGLAGRYGHIIK
jgi:pilus assembly protein CpaC